MKVICKKKEFVTWLNTTSSIMRRQYEMHKCITVGVRNNRVCLYANNTTSALYVHLNDYYIDEDGVFVLTYDNVRQLKEILRSCKQDYIRLKSCGTNLTIGDENIIVPEVNQNEFGFETLKDWDYEITASNLCKLIDRTLFAVNLEHPQNENGGVLFEMTDGCMSAIATNGYRLVHQDVEAKQLRPFVTEGNTIVDKDTLKIAKKLFRRMGDAKIDCTVRSSGEIIFGWNDSMLVGRLIRGQFHQWRRLFPDSRARAKHVIVKLSASDLIRPVREEDSKSFVITLNGRTLAIANVSYELNPSDIVIPADHKERPITLKISKELINGFLDTLSQNTNIELDVSCNGTFIITTDDGCQYAQVQL